MVRNKQFKELDKSAHIRKTFDCGRDELNSFIAQYAARHRDAGISKTMVLPSEANEDGLSEICCFYTLSHTEIKRESLPERIAKKLPRYPVPVMLIAQLAVDEKWHNQGLGKVTLVTALKHCLEINFHLPSYAVVVDVIDQSAKEFYEQYGFSILMENASEKIRLFLPMSTVLQILSQ